MRDRDAQLALLSVYWQLFGLSKHIGETHFGLRSSEKERLSLTYTTNPLRFGGYNGGGESRGIELILMARYKRDGKPRDSFSSP